PVPRPTTHSRRWPDQRISPGRMTWTRLSARTRPGTSISGWPAMLPSGAAADVTGRSIMGLRATDGATGEASPGPTILRGLAASATVISTSAKVVRASGELWPARWRGLARILSLLPRAGRSSATVRRAELPADDATHLISFGIATDCSRHLVSPGQELLHLVMAGAGFEPTKAPA